MKVFISWSGERSKEVGELLDEWLQCVIQAIDPWMSSKDIDRGSLWFSEITDQLKDTSIGIICLTHENMNKPWILFEAGALAKGLSSNRVCTLLIDLQTTDIGDPLAQFNHTLPNRAGIWSLVRTLNSSLGENSIKERILERVFETYWPQFDKKFNDILEKIPLTNTPKKRPNDDILVELLSVTRGLEKRMRTFENDNVYNKNIDGGTFKRSIDSKLEIENAILLYIKKGLSNNMIIQKMLQNYGISSDATRKILSSLICNTSVIELRKNIEENIEGNREELG